MKTIVQIAYAYIYVALISAVAYILWHGIKSSTDLDTYPSSFMNQVSAEWNSLFLVDLVVEPS
jgi:hypothetical protein